MRSRTWISEHFDTPEHARATIAVVTSVGGAIGFLIAVLGVVLGGR